MYFVIVVVVVVIAVGVAVLARTRLGKLLRAMGDSPLALETYGLTVNVTRVLVFCISAFIAAISGALTASLFTYAIGANFPSFSSLTLVALVTVVVVGEPWYAFIAASVITIVPVYVTWGNIDQYIAAVLRVGRDLRPSVSRPHQDADRSCVTSSTGSEASPVRRRSNSRPEPSATESTRPARRRPRSGFARSNGGSRWSIS